MWSVNLLYLLTCLHNSYNRSMNKAKLYLRRDQAQRLSDDKMHMYNVQRDKSDKGHPGQSEGSLLH